MARRFPSTRLFCILILALLALSVLAFSPGEDEHVVEDSPASLLLTPGMGAVNATVRDDAGRPLRDALVTVLGLPGEWRTKPEGNITFEVPANLTGVTYTVAGNKTGYGNGSSTVVVYENVTTNVTIILEGSIISGSVTDNSLRPLNATVSITALGLSTQTLDVDGSYQLRGIPGGNHSVIASATGYSSRTQDAYVPVDDFVLLNFRLVSETGYISGHVRHVLNGTPLDNASVSVQVGSLKLTETSDNLGFYNITNVPEGTYSVTAGKERFFSGTVTDVAVTRGQGTEWVNFSLSELPTILTGVVKSGTLLLVGVNVSVDGTTLYNVSGSDGSYVISNLTAGAYTVVATAAGYETQTIEDVSIEFGTENELDITLVGLPGAILRGTVYASDPHLPLTNVHITIIDLKPQPRSTSTNINGEFEFTGLLEGNYTIRLEKTGYRPLEIGKMNVKIGEPVILDLEMVPLREGFEGFVFGFDMAHSMMILALALTIIILTAAVYLRMRSFQTPGSAPAVYDEADEEPSEGRELRGGGQDGDSKPPEGDEGK